jgi:hypothetical protein
MDKNVLQNIAKNFGWPSGTSFSGHSLDEGGSRNYFRTNLDKAKGRPSFDGHPRKKPIQVPVP